MRLDAVPHGRCIVILDATLHDCTEAAWLTVLEQLCVYALGELPATYHTLELAGIWPVIVSSQ